MNHIVGEHKSGPSLLVRFIWPIRGLWFLLIGWWASGLWMMIAWLISLTLIGLPPGSNSIQIDI